MKAEQYLRDMMVRHKNKLVYDSATGEIRDDRKFMTMLEDYWLPRREGNRGTEITTLPAGQNLGEMADVEYFQKKLYRSLIIPETRLSNENNFNLGNNGEISRDEIKFSKFVDRLRTRFNQLFIKALEKQCILKGIITTDEWKEISTAITFQYARDNHFAEQKNNTILQGRATLLMQMQPSIGKYYSNTWVRQNILMQTEEDIAEMDEQIAEEESIPQYQSIADQQAGGPPEGGTPFGGGSSDQNPSEQT
jgi:hypothetical protein